MTHPEYFDGFQCVALAWQVVLLGTAQDPGRYRPLRIPSVWEKVAFPVAALVLLAQHRIPFPTFAFSLADLLFAALFIITNRQLGTAQADQAAVRLTASAR